MWYTGVITMSSVAGFHRFTYVSSILQAKTYYINKSSGYLYKKVFYQTVNIVRA